jgi:hypothetical protein
MLRAERRPLWQAEQARAPKLSIASAGAGPGSLERNKARKSLGPERGAEEWRTGVQVAFFDATSIFALII